MKIEDIKNPDFLKDLDITQLNTLAKDIRSFLIENVSKTGGHLSPNLGVVELTIALHYVFDLKKDRLLFDVGHQCYCHKILTGRAKGFKNIRKYKGLSGFQEISESPYDTFIAGHASTSLATAIGLSISKKQSNSNDSIIAFVGDASFMSGPSLQALNYIGDFKTNLIIILNDNAMSINKNVGALSKTLEKIRIKKGYINFKSGLKSFLSSSFITKPFIKPFKKIKEKIKDITLDRSFFNDFNVEYYGPIDGHDIESLIQTLKICKEKKCPIVVHCVTQKGKGYKFSENDAEGKWHGVPAFDIESGKFLNSNLSNTISYSKHVANCVYENMKQNSSIFTITPAMTSGSCLNDIARDFKSNFIDCGICEDMAIHIASGLLLDFKRPFVSIYSSFLQRAYDQLNHDISRMNLPIVLGIDRAGIVGEDGSGHNGVFDIAMLNSLPNFIISQGKDFNQIKNLINLAFKQDKPFAIRYPRGNLNIQKYQKEDIKIGKWQYIINNIDDKAIIITYGQLVDTVKNLIECKNIKLINALFIKPIDLNMLDEIFKLNIPIYIYTQDIIKGGLIDSILEYASITNLKPNIKYFGIDDQFIEHGDIKSLYKQLKLDEQYIIDTILKDIND